MFALEPRVYFKVKVEGPPYLESESSSPILSPSLARVNDNDPTPRKPHIDLPPVCAL